MASQKLVIDDDQKFALMKFRRNISDVRKPNHDDFYLVRWLQDRNWNVKDAEKMLREHLLWRSFWDADNISEWEPPEALELYYPSGTTGYDSEGSPVIFIPVSGLDVSGVFHSVSRQDMIKMAIKLLEYYVNDAVIAGGRRVVVVCDMDGFNISDYAGRHVLEMVVCLIKLYEVNYPDILKALYVINASTMFAIAYSVIKRIASERTLRNVYIYNNNARKWMKVLKDTIPLEIIPKHYGGLLVDPDGNPKCPSKIRQGGEIPKSYYRNSLSKYDLEEGEFLSTVIRKGNKFELDFIVSQEGYLLKWEFRTDKHDIRFGVICCDDGGNTTHAVQSQRVTSHRVTESGVISCKPQAKYTVIFDNTYSIFRNKRLYYKIDVVDPIGNLKATKDIDLISED